MTEGEFRATSMRLWIELNNSLAANAAALSHTSFWGDDTTGEAVQAQLDKDTQTSQRLGPGGDLFDQVVAGELAPSRWRAIAQVVKENADYRTGVLKQSAVTWSRLWQEVVYPTVLELREAAQTVYKDSVSLAPWVVTGIVALVVGYIVFAVRH